MMKTKFLSTAIGSMPFEDPTYAVGVSLKSMDAPIWPQLPRLGLLEQMEVQYSENMPCAVVDTEKNRLYFKTDEDYSEKFAEFYETYMSATDGGTKDFSKMAISEKYSKGFYALLKTLKEKGSKMPWLKVQTTGPITFALSIVDENKRAMYYNEEFRDVIVKSIAMKSRWQIQQVKPFAENIICFLDEPILSAFGSSTYVSVKREDVVSILSEAIEAVRAEGGIAGIHCCGNTEWSILIDAGVDIVNFDAFEYGDTIAIYADSVKKHLEKGGVLAWGVVPTSEKIRDQTVDSLE
ncbi:uroporphyrinogen decarboxylase/cobalamine-independent methonine synthase family protein, partial [Treponema sp. R6D11]